MRDRKYLINMYNATSTDDGRGEIESYNAWLERQLLKRIEKIEEMEYAIVDAIEDLNSYFNGGDSKLIKEARNTLRDAFNPINP